MGLGPPLRHIGSTTHSNYLGFIAVDQGPRFYYECAKNLLSKWNNIYRARGIPAVVNTMGWVTGIKLIGWDDLLTWYLGLGFALLQLIVQTGRPTHIIAVKPNSSDDNSDIPEYVWEALYENCKLPFGECQPYSAEELVSVTAVSASGTEGKADRARIEPSELRNLVWYTYFCQRMSLPFPKYEFTIPLSHFTPFQVSWRRVSILCPPNLEKIDIGFLLATLNHGVVGLTLRENLGDYRYIV